VVELIHQTARLASPEAVLLGLEMVGKTPSHGQRMEKQIHHNLCRVFAVSLVYDQMQHSTFPRSL
jgi:hypothetical protein